MGRFLTSYSMDNKRPITEVHVCHSENKQDSILTIVTSLTEKYYRYSARLVHLLIYVIAEVICLVKQTT